MTSDDIEQFEYIQEWKKKRHEKLLRKVHHKIRFRRMMRLAMKHAIGYIKEGVFGIYNPDEEILV